MKASVIVALTLAAFSTASPLAKRYQSWAFSISNENTCNNNIFADAGTNAKGCTNIGKTGGSVSFASASTGNNPVGYFYSGSGCSGSVIVATGDQDCNVGTIQSYKIVA